jgi:hypothetical protein
MKKRVLIKELFFGIAVVFSLLVLFGLLEGKITGNTVKEDKQEKTVIYFPTTADFPNTEEGTVVFNFGFPASSFKVGNKTADILMLLNSERVIGLKIGYAVNENKFYAGMPLISSPEIKILDGNNHNFAYTFNRKMKKQAIFFDGKLLAEGEFTGARGTDMFTGYSVYDKVKWIESQEKIEVRFE